MLSSLFEEYPTFLVFLAVFASMVLSMVFMPAWIRFLKSSNIGQQVRDDGPETHLVKQGTPTMGGVIMLIAVIVTAPLMFGGAIPMYYIMIILYPLQFVAAFIFVRIKSSSSFFPTIIPVPLD